MYFRRRDESFQDRLDGLISITHFPLPFAIYIPLIIFFFPLSVPLLSLLVSVFFLHNESHLQLDLCLILYSVANINIPKFKFHKYMSE